MLSGKLNLVAENQQSGLKFTYEDVPLEFKGRWTTLARIAWGGSSKVTLDSIMQEAKHAPGPEAVKTKAAMSWLQEFLAEGSKPSSEIFESGEVAGFNKKILYKAKESLQGDGPSMAFRDPPGRGQWYWKLIP